MSEPPSPLALPDWVIGLVSASRKSKMGVPLVAVGAAAALCFFAPDAHAGRRGGGGSRGGGRSMGAASSGYKSRGNVGNIYGSKVSQLIVRSIRMSGWRVSS